ncbi:MAG: ABC transporter substrate-binding protein [Roseomonas sp.]|nr:ABC transporter substrate-binding protein [Roseomonas sp.]MCA3393685.1 ABC transporter substrate-binding protein [Roseomonas sp.]MCA3407953.1 ABC transporter substrate-binding protein [Roseomonas sp.]
MIERILIQRRVLLAGIAMLGTAPARAQQMDINRATAFVDRAGQDLVNAINDPRLNQTQRRDRVASILRNAIDIEGTGRFILGRYVRQASPAELQDYLKLFDEIIIRNLSARFGEYRGVKFSLGRSQQRTEEDALVSTLVERPNTAPFTLDWRVAEINGQPRVVDVIAEGTSLRLTTRSEYSAVIQRNGGRVAALLDAMRGQITQLAAREGG